MTATRLIPLAITCADARAACVAGVDAAGRWLRPEPVTVGAVIRPGGPYRYGWPVDLELGPTRAPDPRPEDRHLLSAARPCDEPLGEDRWAELLSRTADPDVTTALAGRRSVGLVRAEIRRLHHRTASSGRSHLRAEFTDERGETFDWIVPDLRMVRAFPAGDAGRAEEFAARWARSTIHLAVGLTKPTGRDPGRFGGCHPLVVGVHPEPGAPVPWQQPEGAMTKG
ncbi:hypothetical protein ACFY4C_03830 [Actinomadura viridis]|uniref:hypothetical protein n=1 Tax=Actinomadura viridis TaxID=58110 RepID=UPI0036CD6B0C